jgi:LysR family hydrogen peroxide-inducible transcriptional activator
LVRPGKDEGTPVPSSETLREMRLLLLEEGHCFRDQALSFCNMRSPLPREVLDASSLSTLVQMVGAGMGITLIPEMAVAVETRSASVSVAPFKDPQPSRTIGMIWRKTSPLARQLLQISDVVCHSADALLRAGQSGIVIAQFPDPNGTAVENILKEPRASTEAEASKLPRP